MTAFPGISSSFSERELAYRDLISEVGRSNAGRLGWWASVLSSRNFGASFLWDHVRRYLETGRIPPTPDRARRFLECVRYQTLRQFRWNPFRLRRERNLTVRKLGAADLIFFTHIDARIRRRGDAAYHDDYWQSLLDRAISRGLKVALVGHVTTDDLDFLWYFLERRPADPPAVPLLFFSRPWDLPWAIGKALAARVDLPVAVPFGGRDLRPMLENYFDWERLGGSLFTELLLFPALRRLVRSTRARAIFWPWENHSWERLLLIARRLERPDLRALGHQHSTVPPSLTNHFPGAAELDYAPFPDRILTTGREARTLLEAFGHFPAGCLEVGCAVRYPSAPTQPDRPPGETGAHRRLGVALTADLPNCQEVLRIAADALAGTGRHVLVKCHPTLPAPLLLRHLPSGCLPQGLQLFEGSSLEEFLGSIDVLAYGKTTVSFEAIARGIPVIHLCDPGNEVDDPLIGCPAYRWRANTAAELRERLCAIESLHGDERSHRAATALAYVENFLTPPSTADLDRFLAAAGFP